MSWHARWGRADPYAKPAKIGDVFGCFKVVGEATSDAHYGLRVTVACVHCNHHRVAILAQLRAKPRTTHRGCNP